MNPEDKIIVKSLIAVAWADGKVESAESELLEHLLTSFDATPDDAAELREYAKTERSLDDIPVDQLSKDDREVLLGNAGIVMRIDGSEAAEEHSMLDSLAKLLGYSADDAKRILEESRDGVLQLAARSLRGVPPPAPRRD
jgi:tellurite resistance protein